MPVRTLKLFLLAVISSGALAACGGDGGGRADGGGEEIADSLKYGGTVTLGAFGDLQSMNSLTSSDNSSGMVQREMLFMPLVKLDEKLSPVPWLAERFDTVRVGTDSLDLTFQLRKDVKWHDGKPVTARDVLFSFDRALDPKTAFPNASNFKEYNTKATLVDEHTIRFRLRAHADLFDAWYQFPPMPEHILGKVPPEQLIQHPFATDSVVGNGPFRFVRRLPKQEWVFAANPDFPAALGGKPYLDRVVYRVVTEPTTLLTELVTGRIDVYLNPIMSQADQIKATPSLVLNTSPFRQWVYIGWNTRLPQFSDARVRRALTMSINRQEIVNALLYGYADPGLSPVTPAHWSYDPKDPQVQLPYDTAAARKLFAEAGWIDRNRDGVLENEQGVPFRFTLKTNQGNDTRRDILEIVQAQLKPMGIQVEPQIVEWTTMITQLQGSMKGGKRVRDFEAVVSSWVDYFRKDDRDILHSDNLDKPYQYVGFSNPRADQLIDTVAIITDHQVGMPYWKEYQRLMVRESPYTVLYYPQRLAGVNKRLQGAVMDIRGELNTVGKWWIHPSQRSASAPAPAAAPAPAGDTAKK